MTMESKPAPEVKTVPQRPSVKKPKSTKPNMDKLREKNKLLAELLEQPSQIAAQLQARNSQQKTTVQKEEYEEDQPLNLCVRDNINS